MAVTSNTFDNNKAGDNAYTSYKPVIVNGQNIATQGRKTTGTTAKDTTPTPSGSGSGGSMNQDEIDAWRAYYSGGSSGGGGESAPAPAETDWNSKIKSDPDMEKNLSDPNAGQNAKDLMANAGLDTGEAKLSRINHVDKTPEENMLNQIKKLQEEQINLQTKNTVENGVKQLQRTQQDAQDQFKVQQNQITADEQRALDNQALYAEQRGDRGGIGQAQYNTIQNNAATNRLTVQKEQTKLATDTQRQITDLRAQGEFEKANNLLNITQDYLGRLMSLYQWADETNLSVDEFNVQLEEWEHEYKTTLLNAEINVANATGAFSNGNLTWNAQQASMAQLRASGQALLEAGIAPTEEQLKAMGMSREQAVAYLHEHFRYGGQ